MEKRMTHDIFDRLRSAVQNREQELNGAQAANRPTVEVESEMRRQLQRYQFFRTHVFTTLRGFLQTVIGLQRGKARATQLSEVVTINYPLNTPPETRYGFQIPLFRPSSPQTKVEQALLTVSMPMKNIRYYLISFQARSVESMLKVEIIAYDELARKISSHFPPIEVLVDSDAEFKEGEFLISLQRLTGQAIKVCIEDML
jgi:hypothetical protein